jgi:hypothetical protein
MRHRVAVTAALVLSVVGLAGPAMADCTADPASCTDTPTATIALEVAQGTLTITSTGAPAPASPPTTLQGAGARASIPLGTTTVKDSRLSAGSWSVTATVSDFASTTGKIPRGRAMFSVQPGWSAPTDFTLPSFATAPSTTPLPVDASGTRTLMTTAAGATGTGITFVPVLTVTVPANVAAGTYTGTVTQSVS